jgi:creatinine amidohydrolase
MSARTLGDAAWPEIGAGTVVAIPLGSCEQHGPHLPLETDTFVALALADSLAGARDEVRRAPAITYSASGEHAGFPGTLSIGTDALTRLLVELRRSADGLSGVVFVNGHGGNVEALREAVERSNAEGRPTLAWSPRLAGDAHAGRVETSLMLALAETLVRTDAAVAGVTEPIGSLMDRLRAEGVRAVSPSGVLGDPAGATADEGRRLLDALQADLLGVYDHWRASPT